MEKPSRRVTAVVMLLIMAVRPVAGAGAKRCRAAAGSASREQEDVEGRAEAAREAGREKLAELNITLEAGKGAVQSLVDGITEAARTSGQAAVSAVREQG